MEASAYGNDPQRQAHAPAQLSSGTKHDASFWVCLSVVFVVMSVLARMGILNSLTVIGASGALYLTCKDVACQLHPASAKFFEMFWIMVIKDCVVVAILLHLFESSPSYEFKHFALVVCAVSCQIGVHLLNLKSQYLQPLRLWLTFPISFEQVWMIWVLLLVFITFFAKTINNEQLNWELLNWELLNWELLHWKQLKWTKLAKMMIIAAYTSGFIYLQRLDLNDRQFLASHSESKTSKLDIALGRQNSGTMPFDFESHVGTDMNESADSPMQLIQRIPKTFLVLLSLYFILLVNICMIWRESLYGYVKHFPDEIVLFPPEQVLLKLVVGLFFINLIEQIFNLRLTIGKFGYPQIYAVFQRMLIWCQLTTLVNFDLEQPHARPYYLLALFTWIGSHDSLINFLLEGTLSQWLTFRLLIFIVPVPIILGLS